MEISRKIYDKLPGIVKNLLPVIVDTNLPKTDANKTTTAYHLPRIRQDIKNWRDAITEAEMPYVPYRVKMQLLFEDTILNGHVRACTQKRKNLTLLKEYAMVDAAGEINEEWTKFLQAQWFRKILNYVLDAQFFGFSFINWTDVVDNTLSNVHIIRRQFISPDRHMLQPYPYSPQGGVNLTADELLKDWTLYVDTSSDVGKSPCGYGLLYNVAIYEIIIRNMLSQNADFVELFSQPIRWARSTKTQGFEYDMLEDALKNMGSSAYIITDPQDEIQILETGTIGSAFASYDNLEKRCESKISKILLGHADALDSVPGKLGAGQGEESPTQAALNEIEITDNVFVQDVINSQLLNKLRNLGFNIPIDLKFQYQNNREKDEIIIAQDLRIKETAAYVNTFKQAGLEVDAAWISERINVPLVKSTEPAAPGYGQFNMHRHDEKKNPCCQAKDHFRITNAATGYINVLLNIAENIAAGEKPKYSFDLYKKTSADLMVALRNAFGKTKATNRDVTLTPKDNLYAVLEANTYMFSAAKTAEQMAELNSRFTAGKTYADFKQDVEQVNTEFNEDYLRTEYNTAYAGGLNGAEYMDRLKDKELFPYVRWQQIDRPSAREEHEELDGQVFRIDELDALPPIDWNCGCSVEYLEPDEIDEADVNTPDDLVEMLSNQQATGGNYASYYDQIKDKGFFTNQARTGEIFDLGKVYNGVPKLGLEDVGLTPVTKMHAAKYEAPMVGDNDLIAGHIKNNADEVYLERISGKVYNKHYVKYFNDNGKVKASYVTENFGLNKPAEIVGGGELTNADKFRTKYLLISKK